MRETALDVCGKARLGIGCDPHAALTRLDGGKSQRGLQRTEADAFAMGDFPAAPGVDVAELRHGDRGHQGPPAVERIGIRLVERLAADRIVVLRAMPPMT